MGIYPNKTVMEDGKLRKYRPERHDYLLFDGKHDAIVNHGLFMSVQERLSKNKSFTNDRSLKIHFTELCTVKDAAEKYQD